MACDAVSCRLVVEAGLGLLPFSEKVVNTPTGHAYVGVDFARKLCGVSIIRSGELPGLIGWGPAPPQPGGQQISVCK